MWDRSSDTYSEVNVERAGAKRSDRRGAAGGRASMRSMFGWPRSAAPRESALAGLVSCLVVGSVLAVGTVHLPVLIVAAFVAFVALAVAFEPGRRLRGGSALPLPAVIAMALAGYTLLQALPLPAAWGAAIAPANADVWERTLSPFGEPGPHWISVSLDPGASFVEALKWFMYAAVFTSAALLGARRGARWGLSLVFLSAVCAALTTIAHGLFNAHKVFGLYEPKFQVSPWHLGPLLNPNNLAGYLNLGACCGLGLMLTQRPTQKWLVGVGVATLVAVEITSGSRGGVVALLLGVIALALLLGIRAREEGSLSATGGVRAKWLLAMAIGGGALLGALGGTGQTWAELYDVNLGKIELAMWARPMVADHLWIGVGRGAFESVFPAYRMVPGHVVFTHPENFIAQWICEWGLPVGAAALLAFAWALSPRRLGALRSAPATAGFVGVATLLLQNFVDLALEVPGVVIALVVVLGSLWGSASRVKSRGVEAGGPGGRDTRTSSRRWMLTMSAVGFALCAIAASWGSRGVAEERRSIRTAYDRLDLRAPEERARLRGALHAAMLRYPAEPYFPLTGALLAFRAHDENPMPWLQRTLERGRINGKAHLLLAEVLMGRNAKRQALFELRLAVEGEAALAAATAQIALGWTTDYEELALAVPEGRAGAEVLDILGALLASTPHEATRILCDREALARNPELWTPHLREAEARLAALAPGSVSELCSDRERCALEIESEAKALVSLRPHESLSAQLRARLLAAQGELVKADELLVRGCEAVIDRAACARTRATIAVRIPTEEPIAGAIKVYLNSSCGATPPECAAAASWAAGLRVARGEHAAAMSLYQRAAQEEPTEARWLQLADTARQAKAHARVAEALEKVAQKRGGGDAELRRQILEERSLATDEALSAP